MVTAKYTEETPIQNVDFTSAAGKGSEAWASVFSHTQDLAYAKAQKDANAKAAQDGINEVAKFGLNASYPTSNSEAAQHMKDAIDRSQSSLLQAQVMGKANQLYQQAAQKGFTPESGQDFKAGWDAYSQATLNNIPDHQRAAAFQALTATGTHFGYSLSRNIGNTVLQNQRLDEQINLQTGQTNLSQNAYTGMPDTNFTEYTKRADEHYYNIMHSSGTAIQIKNRLIGSGTAALQADVQGRVQLLHEAEIRAQSEVDPVKRQKRLEALALQEKYIRDNPDKYVQNIKSTQKLYKFANINSALTTLNKFITDKTTQYAYKSNEAQNNYKTLITFAEDGNAITQDNITHFNNQSAPFDPKADQHLEDLGIAQHAQQQVMSQINDPGAIPNMIKKATSGKLMDTPLGNTTALKMLNKINTLKNTDPNLAAQWIYDRTNKDRNITNTSGKTGLPPNQVTQIQTLRNSPDYLSRIANGKSTLGPNESHVANEYTSQLADVQHNSGVPYAFTAAFTKQQRANLNETIQQTPLVERQEMFKALYNDPTVRPHWTELIKNLHNEDDIARALIAQGEVGKGNAASLELINNKTFYKESWKSIPESTRQSISAASFPYNQTLNNVFPTKIANAVANIYKAHATVVALDQDPELTTGLGVVRSSITSANGAGILFNRVLDTLKMSQVSDNIIASKSLPSPNGPVTLNLYKLNRNLSRLKDDMIDSASYYTPATRMGINARTQALMDQMNVGIIPSFTPGAFYLTNPYGESVKNGHWVSDSPTTARYVDEYGENVLSRDSDGNPTGPMVVELSKVQTMLDHSRVTVKKPVDVEVLGGQ